MPDLTANDPLVGGAGNDKLVGGADSDRYLFRNDWGRDAVFGFTSGIDELDLSDVSGLSSFGQITQTTDVKGNAVASFAGDSVVFKDLTWADLDSGDFVV